MTTALRNLVRLIDTAPGRLARAVAELWYDGLDAANWRGKALGLLVLLALATLPAWGGGPLIATMIAVLWLACAGQAWNLLAGFTGLFSLGHALFIGLGAYLAAAFAQHGGHGLWLGALLAVPAAALAGAALGALGCRNGFKGVHFTLITLILAEAARTGVAHLDGLGGATGLGFDANGLLLLTTGATVATVSPDALVTTIAGSQTPRFGYRDGTGPRARFNATVAVACDREGNAYILDVPNDVIRKVTTTGLVTTLAGKANTPGYRDGTGAGARFRPPAPAHAPAASRRCIPQVVVALCGPAAGGARTFTLQTRAPPPPRRARTST